MLATITIELISKFLKNYILDTTSYLSHFIADWIFYIEKANKITSKITSHLIEKN
jgi:hypothetical protein